MVIVSYLDVMCIFSACRVYLKYFLAKMSSWHAFGPECFKMLHLIILFGVPNNRTKHHQHTACKNSVKIKQPYMC